MIAALTWTNSRGLEYGKIVQNLFTTAKLAALFRAGIVLGLTFGWNPVAVHENFGNFWSPRGFSPIEAGVSAATAFGLIVAVCVAQSGVALLGGLLAQHHVRRRGGARSSPHFASRAGYRMHGGHHVVHAGQIVAYLMVLPLSAIQHAPSDRVATAMMQAMFPAWGSAAMAAAIMISTFGCVNSLVLAGPRVYYAMAGDGLFFPKAATLNKANVPAWSLVIQGLWSAALVLPRTIDSQGNYGNLYSNLLDYVISAALIFYIMTIAGVFCTARDAAKCGEAAVQSLRLPCC